MKGLDGYTYDTLPVELIDAAATGARATFNWKNPVTPRGILIYEAVNSTRMRRNLNNEITQTRDKLESLADDRRVVAERLDGLKKTIREKFDA